MIDVVARSPEGLDAINDVLHDRWFRVDDVAYNEGDRCVRVRFLLSGHENVRGKDDETTGTALVLEIENVEEHQLTESEGVGRYDFNRLIFSKATGVIRVETGIPLRFAIRVSGLGVRVFERAPPDINASPG